MKALLIFGYCYLALLISSLLNIVFLSSFLTKVGYAFPDWLAKLYPTRILLMNHKDPAIAARNIAYSRTLVRGVQVPGFLVAGLLVSAWFLADKGTRDAQWAIVALMLVSVVLSGVVGARSRMHFMRLWERNRGDVVLDAARRAARSSPKVSQAVSEAERKDEPDGRDKPVKRIHLTNAFFEHCRAITDAMKNP